MDDEEEAVWVACSGAVRTEMQRSIQQTTSIIQVFGSLDVVTPASCGADSSIRTVQEASASSSAAAAAVAAERLDHDALAAAVASAAEGATNQRLRVSDQTRRDMAAQTRVTVLGLIQQVQVSGQIMRRMHVRVCHVTLSQATVVDMVASQVGDAAAAVLRASPEYRVLRVATTAPPSPPLPATPPPPPGEAEDPSWSWWWWVASVLFLLLLVVALVPLLRRRRRHHAV